jgi:peptidyl-prolyl cis-trans isomerase C
MVAPNAWASHILVDSKSEAVQIREKVSKLKDFQKLARKKSSCPSAQKGGDLGWFRKGNMVKEFELAPRRRHQRKCDALMSRRAWSL